MERIWVCESLANKPQQHSTASRKPLFHNLLLSLCLSSRFFSLWNPPLILLNCLLKSQWCYVVLMSWIVEFDFKWGIESWTWGSIGVWCCVKSWRQRVHCRFRWHRWWRMCFNSMGLSSKILMWNSEKRKKLVIPSSFADFMDIG